ncbi:MAG: hypothetical protein ABIE94_01190 [archaeon]
MNFSRLIEGTETPHKSIISTERLYDYIVAGLNPTLRDLSRRARTTLGTTLGVTLATVILSTIAPAFSQYDTAKAQESTGREPAALVGDSLGTGPEPALPDSVFIPYTVKKGWRDLKVPTDQILQKVVRDIYVQTDIPEDTVLQRILEEDLSVYECLMGRRPMNSELAAVPYTPQTQHNSTISDTQITSIDPADADNPTYDPRTDPITLNRTYPDPLMDEVHEILGINPDQTGENATASSDALTIRIPLQDLVGAAEKESVRRARTYGIDCLPIFIGINEDPELNIPVIGEGVVPVSPEDIGSYAKQDPVPKEAAPTTPVSEKYFKGTRKAMLAALTNEDADTNLAFTPISRVELFNRSDSLAADTQIAYVAKQPVQEASAKTTIDDTTDSTQTLEETVKETERIGMGTRFSRLFQDDEGNFSLHETAKTARPLYAWGTRIFEEMFGEQSSGIAAYIPIEICDVAQTEPGHIWPVTTFPEHKLTIQNGPNGSEDYSLKVKEHWSGALDADEVMVFRVPVTESKHPSMDGIEGKFIVKSGGVPYILPALVDSVGNAVQIFDPADYDFAPGDTVHFQAYALCEDPETEDLNICVSTVGEVYIVDQRLAAPVDSTAIAQAEAEREIVEGYKETAEAAQAKFGPVVEEAEPVAPSSKLTVWHAPDATGTPTKTDKEESSRGRIKSTYRSPGKTSPEVPQTQAVFGAGAAVTNAEYDNGPTVEGIMPFLQYQLEHRLNDSRRNRVAAFLDVGVSLPRGNMYGVDGKQIGQYEASSLFEATGGLRAHAGPFFVGVGGTGQFSRGTFDYEEPLFDDATNQSSEIGYFGDVGLQSEGFRLIPDNRQTLEGQLKFGYGGVIKGSQKAGNGEAAIQQDVKGSDLSIEGTIQANGFELGANVGHSSRNWEIGELEVGGVTYGVHLAKDIGPAIVEIALQGQNGDAAEAAKQSNIAGRIMFGIGGE